MSKSKPLNFKLTLRVKDCGRDFGLGTGVLATKQITLPNVGSRKSDVASYLLAHEQKLIQENVEVKIDQHNMSDIKQWIEQDIESIASAPEDMNYVILVWDLEVGEWAVYSMSNNRRQIYKDYNSLVNSEEYGIVRVLETKLLSEERATEEDICKRLKRITGIE